jgi:transcriptional regulator with XRE-family HTH domain
MKFSGERLRIARKYKNLTIDGFIKSFNAQFDGKLNNGMVSKWENNKVIPRIKSIHTIADFLKVPPSFLLGKIDFGNILIDLRLKSGLTTEEISKRSQVPLNMLVLFEYNEELPDESELNRIGSVFNIENLKYYVKSLGVTEPISKEELSESKPINSENKDSNIEEQNETIIIRRHFTDLFTILNDFKDVYYKQRLLTDSERNKIQRLIEILLEEN